MVRGRTKWREIVVGGLRAAHTTVRRLGLAAGQRVVAGREAGYRAWDPEVIGVDTATERAVIAELKRHAVCGILVSEEAGETALVSRRGVHSTPTEPVYIIMGSFQSIKGRKITSI